MSHHSVNERNDREKTKTKKKQQKNMKTRTKVRLNMKRIVVKNTNKVNRKAKGVPQSQAAAYPTHQMEEKKGQKPARAK